MGLGWDAHGALRLRPDGRPLAWSIESFNNNQQTNDTLKLCRKYFETIGIDLYIKQVNNPLAPIPNHTVSTRSTGTRICTDWVPVFAQSPKAPCTTKEETQYLFALFDIDASEWHPYDLDTVETIITEHSGSSYADIKEQVEGVYDKVLFRGIKHRMKQAERFNQLAPPASLQHIHEHYKSYFEKTSTSFELMYKMLEAMKYNEEDAATIIKHSETLNNHGTQAWDMLVQTCEIPPPGWNVGPFGEDYSFFGDLD